MRRRSVFRTAGYYLVGSWLLLQVGEVLFPGFGVPEEAIQALFWAVVLGFPVALLFGWTFDLGPGGLTRTPPAVTAGESAPPRGLALRDWVLLAALVSVLGLIIWRAAGQVVDTPVKPDRAVTAGSDVSSTFANGTPLEKLDDSIAVLPFDNLTDDPENGYFCDGMADEILNTLGGFNGLNVIGRTSSFTFREERPPAPRILDQLGARFLLQGSVRISGDRMRISTQLLDERGVQVWSETYDRTRGEAFAIQSEIAEMVAATVAPRIAPQARREYVPDPVAYDHYLRGVAQFYHRDRAAAIPEFERAIELDPNFAAAHVELAAALSVGTGRKEQFERAQDHLDRARALAPNDARGLAVHGLMLSRMEPERLEEAERSLREALAREPNMADALNWLSGVLNRRGDAAGARTAMERGLRVDPLHPALSINLSDEYVFEGRLEEAELLLKRNVGRKGAGLSAYVKLWTLYEMQGRLVERYAITSRFLRETGLESYLQQWQSELMLGRWERAGYWAGADEAVEGGSGTTREIVSRNLDTHLFVLQGRFDAAYTALRREPAFSEDRFVGHPDFVVWWLGVIPALAGDCDTTLSLLSERGIPAGSDAIDIGRFQDREWWAANHVFAWCLQQSGNSTEATAVLDTLETALEGHFQSQAFVVNNVLFFAARNAALRGDLDLAVERLAAAVEAGWRILYRHVGQPMWANLRADPRGAALLDVVAEDIAAQRAEVEAMDREWDPIEWHQGSRSGGTADSP